MYFPGSSLAIQRYIICPSSKGGLALEDRPLSSSKRVCRAGLCIAGYFATHASSQPGSPPLLQGLVLRLLMVRLAAHVAYCNITLSPAGCSSTAGALWNRLVGAAKRHGIYRGQSVHGFRRGSMQHSHDHGESVEQVAGQARIKTPQVAARYLNKRRPQAKLAKMERAAKQAKLG